MLPLWIIDVTEKSDRRDYFQKLVGQISHVYIPEGVRNNEEPSETDDTGLPKVNSEFKDVDPTQTHRSAIDEDTLTAKEQLELEEIKQAQKNAKIEGDYWYYTNLEGYFSDCPESSSESPSAGKSSEEMAEIFYQFQSDLVKEGGDFIQALRQSNVKPYQTINVVVLGDITEEFSRKVFSSIAIMLQKEKGRFLPHHIHQGMEILGMLYIPCDVNTRSVEERNRIRHMLTEIEVQHTITSIRGYDHMMLYQNVQNRTECAYKLLDSTKQAEYLLQCLVNLYFACDINHPLISGTGATDRFYLSMGAASAYFDMSIEDKKEEVKIAQEIVGSFKEKGEQERANPHLRLFNENDYLPSDFIIDLYSKIRLDELELEDPNPHPIRNFAAKHLKRFYYNYYLRFYPAKLMRMIVAAIEKETKAYLEDIAVQSKRKLVDAQNIFLPNLTEKIGLLTADDGGLPAIMQMLQSSQELFSNHRKTIQESLEEKFWQYLIKKDFVPKNQQDAFLEYHDTYVNDIKLKNRSAGCERMKGEAIDDLSKHLSKESTFLSRLVRSLLLGIISVLAIVPILDLISPDYINLGDVRGNAFIWASCVFIIPALVELASANIFHRKKRLLVRRVKALYLHDAYARLANRIDSEINNFYDKMIETCDEYQKRCERIRKEVIIRSPEDLDMPMAFPETTFNQPLNGGQFNGEELIPVSDMEDTEVKVNYARTKIRDLDKKDYYLLINQFRKDFEILFKDNFLTENFKKEFDRETGEERLLTKSQQEAQKDEKWEKNKTLFKEELCNSIRNVMVPRENPTVGEKIMHYYYSSNHASVLEPIFRMSASNGELSSSADIEYADVKVNQPLVNDITEGYLPITNTKFQIERYDFLYKKYLFVTRWSSYDYLSLNRILPREDFDQELREGRVYEAEQQAKNKAKDKNRADIADTTDENLVEEGPAIFYPSSLMLWAISPEDTSTEWFKLFPNHFSEAYAEREKYRKIMNKND